MNRVATVVVRATSAIASGVTLIWAAFGRERAPTAPRGSPLLDLRPVTSPALAETTSDELVARAADRDPFGVGAPLDKAPPPTTTVVANEELPRVLGTVVDSADGSFALCQLGARPAVIIRSGQRLGDYVLQRVGKGSVVFAKVDGSNIELRVPRAGE